MEKIIIGTAAVIILIILIFEHRKRKKRGSLEGRLMRSYLDKFNG